MDLSDAKATPTNTNISGSHRIRSRKAMRDYLTLLREHFGPDMAVSLRDMESQVREWRAHNFFYRIHVFRKRTKDVDLELKQAWWREWFCRVVDWLYFWDTHNR